MAGPSLPTFVPRAPRPRRRLLTWVVIACVLAVVIEVAAVTNAFGLLSLGKANGSSGSTGTNPNPSGEMVTSVVASITYSGGGADPFPNLQGTNLCAKCPSLPTNNVAVTPAEAVLWVYFNVSFSGSSDITISNFTLTSSGPNASLFKLAGVYVYPRYSEPATEVLFNPGIPPVGLGIEVTSTSIPDDGATGYSLTFHLTSP